MSDSYKIYASKDYVDSKSLPFTTSPHQQLVTGADGVAKWEERTHYRRNRVTITLNTAKAKPNPHEGKTGVYESYYTAQDDPEKIANFHTIGYELALNVAKYSSFVFYWDGVRYEFTRRRAPAVYGNNDKFIDAYVSGDSGEPFAIAVYVAADLGPVYTIQVYYEDEGEHILQFELAEPDLKRLDEDFIPTTVPVIPSATVGQTIAVKSVDENGKPVEWETADLSFEETDPTVPAWAKTETKPSYTAAEVGADPSGTADSAVSTHNTSTSAHNDIRNLITGLTTRLNTLADSDDTTLDQLSEIVAYIKSNKTLIENVTTNKVNVSDIIDNLTTNIANKPLSAAQGVALKALIDAITVPDQLSDLTEDETHRLVTDTEKATWNAKSNFSGSYNDLTNKPTIPSIDGLATETYVDNAIDAIPAPVKVEESQESIYVLESSDIDTTLSVSGKAADAAAVGEAFEKMETQNTTKVALPTSNGTPNYGTAGQFAVSDGKGGIVWKTLVETEEVSY